MTVGHGFFGVHRSHVYHRMILFWILHCWLLFYTCWNYHLHKDYRLVVLWCDHIVCHEEPISSVCNKGFRSISIDVVSFKWHIELSRDTWSKTGGQPCFKRIFRLKIHVLTIYTESGIYVKTRPWDLHPRFFANLFLVQCYHRQYFSIHPDLNHCILNSDGSMPKRLHERCLESASVFPARSETSACVMRHSVVPLNNFSILEYDGQRYRSHSNLFLHIPSSKLLHPPSSVLSNRYN